MPTALRLIIVLTIAVLPVGLMPGTAKVVLQESVCAGLKDARTALGAADEYSRQSDQESQRTAVACYTRAVRLGACRDVTRNVRIEGKSAVAVATLCPRPNGAWVLVPPPGYVGRPTLLGLLGPGR